MEKEFDFEIQHHGISDEILDGIFSEKDKGQNTRNENIECTCGSNLTTQIEEKETSQTFDQSHMKKQAN